MYVSDPVEFKCDRGGAVQIRLKASSQEVLRRLLIAVNSWNVSPWVPCGKQQCNREEEVTAASLIQMMSDVKVVLVAEEWVLNASKPLELEAHQWYTKLVLTMVFHGADKALKCIDAESVMPWEWKRSLMTLYPHEQLRFQPHMLTRSSEKVSVRVYRNVCSVARFPELSEREMMSREVDPFPGKRAIVKAKDAVAMAESMMAMDGEGLEEYFRAPIEVEMHWQ